MPIESLESADDASLLAAAAAGEEEAFARLFDLHSSAVLGVLLRYLRNRAEAEELLQEVFLEAWKRAQQYRASRGNVLTWLILLARSRAVDRLRSRNSRDDREERWVREKVEIEEHPVGTSRMEMEQQSGEIRQALEKLPEEQRMCVVLSFFEGLSQSQISGRLGVPLGTVKSRYLFGMRKLKAHFQSSPEPMSSARSKGGSP